MQTIIFKHSLFLLCDSECVNTTFIFQFETCFSCAILNSTQHLYDEFGIFDITTTSAKVFILNILVAHVALILNFNKLSFNNKAKNFQYIAYNSICWDCFNQTDCLVRLEISYLIFDLSYDFEIVNCELELGIYVDLIRNFPLSILYQKHKTLQNSVFQVNFASVADKEVYLRLIICRFHIYARSYDLCWLTISLLLIILYNYYKLIKSKVCLPIAKHKRLHR